MRRNDPEKVVGICGLFCETCPSCGEILIWYEDKCRHCGGYRHG